MPLKCARTTNLFHFLCSIRRRPLKRQRPSSLPLAGPKFYGCFQFRNIQMKARGHAATGTGAGSRVLTTATFVPEKLTCCARPPNRPHRPSHVLFYDYCFSDRELSGKPKYTNFFQFATFFMISFSRRVDFCVLLRSTGGRSRSQLAH